MLSKTLFFLSFLAALFVVSYAQTNCVLFDNCNDCIMSPGDGCGWCETTGLCLAGNAVGPGGSQANCTTWYYDSCLAVDCFRFTSCATCVSDDFCGYCGATATCVEGNRGGPATGSCASGYVFGSSSQCSGATSTTGTVTTGTVTTGTASTTGRRTTSTTGTVTSGGSSSGSSSGGSSSSGSTGGSSSGGSGSSSGSSSGRRTTGGSSSGGSSSGSSSGGRRTTGGSSGGSSSGSSGGSSSGSSGGSSGGSSSGGSTSGGSPPIFNSESSASVLSPASFLVAVVVLVLLNLLW